MKHYITICEDYLENGCNIQMGDTVEMSYYMDKEVDTSLFDEKTKKDGIITSSLYVNTLNIDTHFIISLINSCDKYEELIKRNEIYQDVYYSQNKITKGGNSND